MNSEDLPEAVREQAGDMEQIFAVHNGEGAQVAYVADLRFAGQLAAENNVRIVTLH